MTKASRTAEDPLDVEPDTRLTFGRVGVVGGGLMGSGIAEIFAFAGCDVIVSETDSDRCDHTRAQIGASVYRAVRTGRRDRDLARVAVDRIRTVVGLDELCDRQLVVEAVVEAEGPKVEVFGALDRIVQAPDAVLASNTSSIPIMKLAVATSRPEQVIGVHFFNPAPVMRLVELVPSLLTSDTTRDRVAEFVTTKLRKDTICCDDRAGFVANALLVPYLLSAVRMLESGYASAEDIDTAMVQGCAHPMGPLHLTDLIGLDTVKAIAESMYAEFKDPFYSPPPLLVRMVAAGLVGRKSGRGFHNHD